MVDSAVGVVAVDSAEVELVAEARSLVLPHRHQRRVIARFVVHTTHELVGTGRPMEMVGTEIRVVSQGHRVQAT